MLGRQDCVRLFLDEGHVEIDSNPVENAIHSLATNRRNTLFAGNDEGCCNWAQFRQVHRNIPDERRRALRLFARHAAVAYRRNPCYRGRW